MRGPIEGVNALCAPVLYAFQQAREELARYTDGLSTSQLWATPYGLGSVGFHILHIGGSTDRLMSYLQGRQLTERQLHALAGEATAGGISRDELLTAKGRGIQAAEGVVVTTEARRLV